LDEFDEVSEVKGSDVMPARSSTQRQHATNTCIISFANLDFVSFMPIGCVVTLTYHHHLLGYTLLPLGISAVLIALYWFFGKGTRSAAKEDIQTTLFSSFLTFTFFILPTTSTKVLNTFNCVIFDGDYGRFLKGDYR
tara:strand:+ start:148 stop:558 length:411 start_codon:yes stop_codon:yes gene_type:complete